MDGNAPVPTGVGTATPAGLGTVAEQVRRHLTNNDTKSALKLAKAVHKDLASPQSEALLIDAYLARIPALRKRGLLEEAATLARQVADQHPSARSRVLALVPLPAPRQAWEQAAAALNDPGIDPAERQDAERTIRRDLTDLRQLADCPHLDADHDLRRAAAALAEAFDAVTRGPIGDEQLALGAVSRRSPLADWKILVRAIASFYRRQDADCRRLVDSLDGDSAAARLVPVLRRLLGGPGRDDKGAAGRLVESVRQDASALHTALRDLDGVLDKLGESGLPDPDRLRPQRKGLFRSLFDRRGRNPLHDAIRVAVRQCRQMRPDLLERLKQHISIRCLASQIPPEQVVAAMSGHSRHDSYFWRLMARYAESRLSPLDGAALWEEFRRHAVHEGLLAADSAQEAAVFAHMADLLERMGQDELEFARDEFEESFVGFGKLYRNQPEPIRALAPTPRQVRDFYYLYPEQLFERIARVQPDPAVYARWLAHARRSGGDAKAIDDVALRWHRALPSDKAPLLHLVESAEQRNALNKALKLLRQAESVDALDPAIKRARLRLCVSKFRRHLGQGRYDLAERDIAEMSELPQAREGDHPALVLGFRWLNANLAGRSEQAGPLGQDVARLLGDELAGCLLLAGLANGWVESGVPLPELPDGDIVKAAVRVYALADHLAVPIRTLPLWRDRLCAGLSAKGATGEPTGLLALTRAAVRDGDGPLAFLASGVGLRLGGPTEARFLMLRGQSLPAGANDRRSECFSAAAELARRRRDADLLAEIGQLSRAHALHWTNEQMPAEMLAKVLGRERQDRKPPGGRRGRGGDYDLPAPAPPPRTRRRRQRRRPSPADFVFDFDLGDFDDGEDGPGGMEEVLDGLFPPDPDGDRGGRGRRGAGFNPLDMPPDLAQIIVKLFVASRGRPPTPRDLERMADEDPEMMEEFQRVFAKYGLG